MKELFSVFGSDVFRSVVTLLMPGFLAISSYVIRARVDHPTVNKVMHENPGETIIILMGAAILIGLLLDDFGTHIEAGWDERCPAGHNQNWYCYLRWAFKTEPIGHRYMRNLVTRLKFELGAYGAALLALPGGLALVWRFLPWPSDFLLSLFWVSMLPWLRMEAKFTHRALSNLRAHMLLGVVEGPDAVPEKQEIASDCTPPVPVRSPWAWCTAYLSTIAVVLFLETIVAVPSWVPGSPAGTTPFWWTSSTWIGFLTLVLALCTGVQSIWFRKEHSRIVFIGVGILLLPFVRCYGRPTRNP